MTTPIPEENSVENSSAEEVSSEGDLATNSTPEEPSPVKRGFLSSTLEELKLVVWPTRQQLFSESIAVILMVALSAASIAAISRFYGWGATQIFG